LGTLTSITADANNPNYASQDGILYNKTITAIVFVPKGIGNVTIPASITSIDEWAFGNSPNLVSVTIPVSVTSIGNYAFTNSTSLASITIPASVTSIGEWAFNLCRGLTSVTFSGTIASSSFDTTNAFPGDLRDKYYATNTTNGTPGTYIRSGAGTTADPYVWTKQP
jgi:hypothetical protein